VIGILRTPRREADRIFPPVFERAMRSLGWQDGANIRLEYRWADGRNDNLSGLARELVSRKVDLLIAFGNTGVAAAQTASNTTPIVGMTDDMVAAGLAASMANPGGNTTGISILGTELDSKRLEILHELVPQARRLGILFDRSSAPLSAARRNSSARHQVSGLRSAPPRPPTATKWARRSIPSLPPPSKA
jgi:putative ABC transport system substrate-binding protein